MAYSADLRNKALNYYEQCKNISQTAATFNLSRNTLYLWIRLKKQTGSLKHQVTGLNAVKLDRQKLAQYVGQHQDAYLHEIAKHFDCTAAAVCYALKQMGMTRKKRPPLTKNKTRPKWRISWHSWPNFPTTNAFIWMKQDLTATCSVPMPAARKGK